MLSELSPREEEVLAALRSKRRAHENLEEVVRSSITRERIRQIEAKALRKIRHPSRSKRLKDLSTKLKSQENSRAFSLKVSQRLQALADFVPSGLSVYLM